MQDVISETSPGGRPRSLFTSKNLLILSLIVSLSIMYQIYFVGFERGEIHGGGLVRTLLKGVFLLLFTFSLRKHLSWRVFLLNSILKIPLLFVGSMIFLLSPFLVGADLQAVNILFFVPVLFIDWNLLDGRKLYELIWKAIVAIVTIQLFVDPVVRVHSNVAWENLAYIGGMGNPNVFGIFLVASGIASHFFLPPRLRHLSIPLFLATMLTGSLVSAIVGLVCLGFHLVILARRVSSKITILLLCVAVPVAAYAVSSGHVSNVRSMEHVLGKLSSLRDLVSGDYQPESSLSISGRLVFLLTGLGMMAESPLSLVFGHPAFIPMYNGDGLWTSYLVSFGFPVVLLFLAANMFVFYRGIVSKSPDLLFSSWIVAISMVFFVTNRILDYWPSALLYFLAFTYLSVKGVKPRRADEPRTRLSSDKALGPPIKGTV